MAYATFEDVEVSSSGNSPRRASTVEAVLDAERKIRARSRPGRPCSPGSHFLATVDCGGNDAVIRLIHNPENPSRRRTATTPRLPTAVLRALIPSSPRSGQISSP